MSAPTLFRIEYQSKVKIERYLAEHPDDSGLEFSTPEDIYESRDIDSSGYGSVQGVARATARANECTVTTFRRKNIRDVTPAGDPPGLIFDWEEEWLEDVGP